MVLLAFAIVNMITVVAGLSEGPLWPYPVFASAIAAGVAGISMTRGFDRRLVTYTGELAILGVAVVWMFFVVQSNVATAYGLAEFIIGTLGLALLRFMNPRWSISVFAGLGLTYGVILWFSGMWDISPWINAAVFCTFGTIWSFGMYNMKITEYRNIQLLKQLNRQNEQLTSLALRDALTGLPNRRYFNEIRKQIWTDSREAGGLTEVPVAFILLDIDHFKEYNDRLGHPEGDTAIQTVARLIQSTLRPGQVAARLGGEEFAIVFNGGTVDSATRLAREVVRTVRSHSNVTISGGVAAANVREVSSKDLYEAADKALYRAKAQGRDQVIALNALESLKPDD